MTPQEFERWQHEPPQLELSTLVAALHDANATAGPEAVTAALDQLMQPPPSLAPAALAPTGSTAGPALEATDRRPPGHRRARPGDRTRPPAEPDRWIAGPDGIDGLVAQASAAGEPLAGAVGGFDLAPAAGPAPTPGGDPRIASIVRIIAGTRDGSAVYVRPDLVLTTAALVAGSAVVEIATADGMRVLGLVARADQARNLALVQVAHPGPPAALYDGPPAPGGGQVEGIALTEGAGVLVTPGRYRAGSGSAAADVAKIEVRAPPAQLEGLPWFLGDQVIAIGAGGGVGQGQGGVRAVQASNSRFPVRRGRRPRRAPVDRAGRRPPARHEGRGKKGSGQMVAGATVAVPVEVVHVPLRTAARQVHRLRLGLGAEVPAVVDVAPALVADLVARRRRARGRFDQAEVERQGGAGGECCRPGPAAQLPHEAPAAKAPGAAPGSDLIPQLHGVRIGKDIVNRHR